jgi:pyridoxine/pyridoxamine 5'-phosphate oxidase
VIEIHLSSSKNGFKYNLKITFQILNISKDAIKCDQIEEANAMILATATKDGYPSNRPVLLKVIQ